MKTRRIHVTGASGSGVTTVGRALANRLAISHFDTDDFYWLPTRQPFREKREPIDRVRLMREVFMDSPQWVLTGSISSWGNPLVERFDRVAFITAPTPVRLERLRRREAVRFGADAVAKGGVRHDESDAFLEWAGHYDDSVFDGRSRRLHEAWLAALPCPITRLDGEEPIDSLVDQLVADIG